MNWKRVVLVVVLGLSLLAAVGVSAEENVGWTTVNGVTACKDSATVVADVYSTYASNLVRVRVYYLNEDGEYQALAVAKSGIFGAGNSRVMVTVPYADRSVAAGTSLLLDVQLKRSYGVNAWADLGAPVLYYTSAADKDCTGRCGLLVETSDGAPADGTITLRSRFGSWFRPEGALLGASPVTAGYRAKLVFAGLPCDWTVRVWYYPRNGDTTPRMLPSQYWPGEFQITALDLSNPYVTSFAAGLPATAPLEEDDPYVVR